MRCRRENYFFCVKSAEIILLSCRNRDYFDRNNCSNWSFMCFTAFFFQLKSWIPSVGEKKIFFFVRTETLHSKILLPDIRAYIYAHNHIYTKILCVFFFAVYLRVHFRLIFVCICCVFIDRRRTHSHILYKIQTIVCAHTQFGRVHTAQSSPSSVKKKERRSVLKLFSLLKRRISDTKGLRKRR